MIDRRWLVTVGLSASWMLLHGCGGGPEPMPSMGLTALDEREPQAVTSGRLDASGLRDRSPEQTMALLAEAQRNSRIDLESSSGPEVLGADASPIIDDDAPVAQANRGPSVALDDMVQEDDESAIDLIAPLPEPEPVEAPEPTDSERYATALEEIHRQIGERAGASMSPAVDLARLEALALLGPSAAAPVVEDARLTPREVSQLRAWREFIQAVGAGLESAEGVEALREPTGRLAQKLGEWSPLEIARAALCTRVDGYGIFDELQSYDGAHKFMAGRPVKFIVYVELEHVTHSSVSRDGVWGNEVTLSQDLRLYHMAIGGDTLVWRLPNQSIHDFSRNRRRDFFVVQLVDLPATLSVGGYQLKITITDRASGEIAERIVPLEIVADARAFQSD